jgi:hypothetical protein
MYEKSVKQNYVCNKFRTNIYILIVTFYLSKLLSFFRNSSPKIATTFFQVEVSYQ